MSKPDGNKGFKQQELSLSAFCFDYYKLKEVYELELERLSADGESLINEEPLPF